MGLNLEQKQAVVAEVSAQLAQAQAVILAEYRSLPVGTHEASWDARDARGQKVGAGVYFVRVRQGDRVDSREIVLVD